MHCQQIQLNKMAVGLFRYQSVEDKSERSAKVSTYVNDIFLDETHLHEQYPIFTIFLENNRKLEHIKGDDCFVELHGVPR